MKWTLFVLDFDETYNNEPEDENGVQPSVYLVPTNEIENVYICASNAKDDFYYGKSDLCIGDYFEERLSNNGIRYKEIGSLDLTFGERNGEYLSTQVEMEVV